MNLEGYLTIESKDKYGRLIDFKRQSLNSYVMAFIDLLCIQMSTTTQSMTDTGNTTRSVNISTNNFDATSAAGTTTYGMRVGTGTNAVAIGNYALQTPIAHGNGSGQLAHGATTVSLFSTVGTSRQFTVSRTFTNNSGAGITVNEVGIYVRGVSAFYFMIERTLSTLTINNATSSTVTYTIKVTV
jgi:hypothetical protein